MIFLDVNLLFVQFAAAMSYLLPSVNKSLDPEIRIPTNTNPKSDSWTRQFGASVLYHLSHT